MKSCAEQRPKDCPKDWEQKDEILILRVTKSDLARISEKMAELGIQNKSAYIRKMALDGYCVRLNLSEVNELVRLLRICSNNLNQYAKRANETGNLYEADVRDLQKRMEEIWNTVKEILAHLASIG
jgi:predicted RNase H-like nuclease (RuvC/YqgF family)